LAASQAGLAIASKFSPQMTALKLIEEAGA
jgi:hypothetical protein